jgi:hypothetical protein
MAELKRQRDAIGVQLARAIGSDGGFEGESAKATWLPQRGSVAWQECALALGATDELIEQHREPEKRVLRVTMKEG